MSTEDRTPQNDCGNCGGVLVEVGNVYPNQFVAGEALLFPVMRCADCAMLWVTRESGARDPITRHSLASQIAWIEYPDSEARISAVRTFKIVQRRRYVLVAEAGWWVADKQRCDSDFTARWFFDKTEQRWYMAESWKRPNRRYPIPDQKADEIAGIILRSRIVRG